MTEYFHFLRNKTFTHLTPAVASFDKIE